MEGSIRSPFAFVLLLFLMGLSACSLVGEGDERGSSQPPLAGSDWQLVRFDVDTLETGVPENQEYSLLFGEIAHPDEGIDELVLGATNDCNSVGGFYTASPEEGRLDLHLRTTTLVGCGDDSLGEVYIDLLDRAHLYEVTDGGQQLVLYSEKDVRLLTYRRGLQ